MPQILVAGDVRGKLGRLFKRVSTVNAKNGPFEAVFCVGEFFPSEEEAEAEGVRGPHRLVVLVVALHERLVQQLVPLRRTRTLPQSTAEHNRHE